MQLQTDEDFAGAEFQSTPSTEAGRCSNLRQHAICSGGFNPRPALRLGDAILRLGYPHHIDVSIHAQH